MLFARIAAAAVSALVVWKALKWDEVTGVAAFMDNQSLFAWHPSLMALGMLWMFSEAVSAVRRRAGLKGAARATQVVNHSLLVTLATLLGAAGFFAIYQNKINIGKPHFTSWHGCAGLAAMVLMAANLLNGVLSAVTSRLGFFVWRSAIHRYLGVLAYATAVAAASLGMVSGWGAKQFGPMHPQLPQALAGVVALAGAFVAFGPIAAPPSATGGAGKDL
eukprot:g5310.t1